MKRQERDKRVGCWSETSGRKKTSDFILVEALGFQIGNFGTVFGSQKYEIGLRSFHTKPSCEVVKWRSGGVAGRQRSCIFATRIKLSVVNQFLGDGFRQMTSPMEWNRISRNQEKQVKRLG